jgi:hypothetical protein
LTSLLKQQIQERLRDALFESHFLLKPLKKHASSERYRLTSPECASTKNSKKVGRADKSPKCELIVSIRVGALFTG